MNSTDLISQKCVPCEGGVDPLKADKIKEYSKAISSEWKVVDNKSIRRQFKFRDFKEAIAFVNKVANLAEEEGHHPDFTINYSKVTLDLSTHAIGGLSDNDFIMAAKIEDLS